MTSPPDSLRALVVQESSMARQQLISVLERDRDITVVGPADTASEAIRLVHQGCADVVILDLQLTDGSGLQAIEQIMAANPTPILLLATGMDERDSPSAVQALRAGALDALPIPAQWTAAGEAAFRHSVRRLRDVTVIRHPRGRLNGPAYRAPIRSNHRPVVAIGASTGGPSALACVLAGLTDLPAPVLVVQHLHPDFTSGLLTWMSRVCDLPVQMAEHRLRPVAGHVYLAPSGAHLRLGTDYHLELTELPASLHRPSANQLFHSVAEAAGSAAVGVLLTGMGEDGAEGLLHIHRDGGRTLAQDEASSVVFGMPGAAHRLGAVSELLPLDRIAAAVGKAVSDIGS
jgi:two-component system chemotaxis response regulator CheB